MSAPGGTADVIGRKADITSLDDFSKRYHMLEVRCGNCTRSGRLRIDKLIDEHGRDMSLPDLRGNGGAIIPH
jgi:hypothetical protein